MIAENATILVIDDDPFFRTFARAVLEQAGFTCVEADSAVKGMLAAATCRPDLILLDYVMPINDGINVLEGLDEIDGLSETPVILLSAWQSEKVKKQVQWMGAIWLDKPVSSATLLSTVERRLSAQTGRRARV